MLSDTWTTIDIAKLHNVTTQYENEFNKAIGINKPAGASPKTNVLSNKVSSAQTVITTSTTTSPIVSTTEEVPSENSEEYDYEEESTATRNKRQVLGKNYVYVTKLWPFVKYKTLYSESIQYHKLRLKLSVSYLTNERKEPLIGKIDYLENFSSVNANECDEKNGKIMCLMSRSCVTGKT
jgi:hypothetical protein